MTSQPLRLFVIAASALLLLCCAGAGIGGLLFYRASSDAGGGRYPLQINSPGTVSGLGDIAAIAAGSDHSLARDSDGAVWAWGSNAYGQLGTPTGKDCGGNTLNAVACSHQPVRILGLPPVRAIAAGANHSLAIDNAGAVWSWGWNQSGQLGDGTTTDRLAPAAVPGLANATAIAAGDGHSLALLADGTVWQWGADLAGQRTCQPPGWSTSFPCSPGPAPVGGLPVVTAVAAGGGHNLALDQDGSVWAWGRNGSGQLGLSTATDQPAPTRIPNFATATAIAAGRHHSLALDTSGNAWGWGDNSYGQIAIRSRDSCPHPSGSAAANPCSRTPVGLRSQGDLAALAAGDGRTLLQTRTGTALRLGYLDPDPAGFGSAADACQLTPPTTDLAYCKAHPTLVADLAGVTAIAAGDRHFLALAPDRSGKGTVHAWGYNYHGQAAR